MTWCRGATKHINSRTGTIWYLCRNGYDHKHRLRGAVDRCAERCAARARREEKEAGR